MRQHQRNLRRGQSRRRLILLAGMKGLILGHRGHLGVTVCSNNRRRQGLGELEELVAQKGMLKSGDGNVALEGPRHKNLRGGLTTSLYGDLKVGSHILGSETRLESIS